MQPQPAFPRKRPLPQTIQLVLIGVIWRALSRSYKGVPVAKLPFVPFKFFERLTHSGLPGEDPTDLAFHGLVSNLSRSLPDCSGTTHQLCRAEGTPQAGTCGAQRGRAEDGSSVFGVCALLPQYVLCSAAVRGMVSKLVNKQETELLITHGTKSEWRLA